MAKGKVPAALKKFQFTKSTAKKTASKGKKKK